MDNKKYIQKKVLADSKNFTPEQLSKKYNLSIKEIKEILNSSSHKYPKWFYVILVAIPIIFLVLLELSLRAFDYGYNLEQWVDAGNDKLIINPEIGRRYFPSGNFVPNTIEDMFDLHKKPDAFRVFVLGGSSAQGYPFNPMGAFSRYIRKRLELVYPQAKIEIVNISMTAVNSYTILDLLPGVLEQKPDLILIYAGHNEYYGALGVGSVESFGTSRNLVKLMLFLNKFKTTQLLRDAVNSILSLFSSDDRKSRGTLMSEIAENKLIPIDSEEYFKGVEQFRNNLDEILQLAKEKGTPVILGKLVCNLKDQKPFASIKYRGNKTAIEIYENAKKELEKNNFSKAESLFVLAKDLDALRFRAPQALNEVIDQLGNKYKVAVVPLDSVFNSVSPFKIVGDNLFVDHLHPNLQGYQLIGKSFYDYMYKYGYLNSLGKEQFPYEKQDSITLANFVFTPLDSVLGIYYVKLLKSDWPFTQKRRGKFNQHDLMRILNPKDFIDSIAAARIENKISWVDAHLIAATYHLRRDEIKDYLKYMDVIIYQYPILKDLDGALRFFYAQNKINLNDYTPRRNGLMALYIGNYDNAIRYLKLADKSEPGNSVILYNLALAFYKKNNFDSATVYINKSLRLNPHNKEAVELNRLIKKNKNSRISFPGAQ
ncbi:GDSL-type esterase/lipase family protein [Melioribacter sp. OK-6-Me]|uniref:GDSL-type esterase/lipase family protein n=1 Tax=unclassified Melioribacter TaxID=2627329 RepID=UPI003EDB0D96